MTHAQLLDALAAVRHYAEHNKHCSIWREWGFNRACSCGLDDVLRGIDAMLAGRNTGNTPEAPESSTGKEPLQVRGDDDGN